MSRGKRRTKNISVLTEDVKNVKKTASTTVYKWIIAVMAIVMIFVTSVLVGIIFKLQPDNGVISFDEFNEQLGIDGQAGQLPAKGEVSEMVSKLGSALTNLNSKSFFVNVIDGYNENDEETYISMIFNNKGESLTQASETGYTAIFRNDHSTIRFTDKVSYDVDSDILTIMNKVHEMAKNGKATVLSPMPGDRYEGYTTVIVDLRGWDSIYDMYKVVNDDFAYSMTAAFKEAVIYASQTDPDSGLAKDEEANFRYVFVIGNESNIVESCINYVWFGTEASETVKYSQLQGSWAFDSVTLIGNWEVNDFWYEYDWTKLPEVTDFTELNDELRAQYKIAIARLHEWAIESGYSQEEIDKMFNGEGTISSTTQNQTSTTDDIVESDDKVSN